MRSPANVCLLCAVASIALAPAEVRAEGYVTPWIGLDVASTTDSGRGAFGVTTGYMSGGVFGFEADIGYAPDFGPTGLFRRDSAITAMGSFILGVPIGGTEGPGIRPFVSGGFGIIRTHNEVGNVIEASRSNNAFDYSLGVGMMGFFNQHLGLRGDVRYVRMLQDTDLLGGIDLEPGRLQYWRVTGGVTFR
jgi:outer membrane protein with beta-barrel domain